MKVKKDEIIAEMYEVQNVGRGFAVLGNARHQSKRYNCERSFSNEIVQ